MLDFFFILPYMMMILTFTKVKLVSVAEHELVEAKDDFLMFTGSNYMYLCLFSGFSPVAEVRSDSQRRRKAQTR